MAELTLFERLSRLESPVDDHGISPVERETRSVMNHLRELLNTHKGSTAIDLEYGIPDMTNFPGDGLTETRLKMERYIKTAIETYEPRLSDINIVVENDPNDVLTLRFKLEASLKRYQGAPIVVETVINPSGRVNVNR